MKINLDLLQTRIFCTVALGVKSLFCLAPAAETSADTPPAATALSWAQLRAKAAVNPTFSDANWSSMGGMAGGGYYGAGVNALAVSGSNLYVGGSFWRGDGSAATNIAKWDGTNWMALGSGIQNGVVLALAVSGSDLYAGGRFWTAGGSAANSIAKWDGSSWSALGSGLSSPGEFIYVSALAVSGNDLYAGGTFTVAGGNAASHIAKWNGSSWSALGSGIGNVPGEFPWLYALAVSGSDLYVGGVFATAGGSPANTLAKWNGSSWSAVGSGLSGGDVIALAVSGADLYAGGSFTTAGGSAANGLAKWNGSSWSALGSGINGGVSALSVSGGYLFGGGSFTMAGGKPATNIAKWDGSSWSALGSGLDDYVKALAVSGSDLYAGGGFMTAGGKVSELIARAYLPTLPTVSVLRSGEHVTVSWPTVDTAGFALEQTGALASPAGWVTNSVTVSDDGANKSVSLRATNGPEFFRLRRP
jgi:hypothetical protein